MTKSTHALSVAVILDFCLLCDKAHEYWRNHLELFDNNPRNAEICNSIGGREWQRLSIVSQEYSLLQVRKLHDPAGSPGKFTLGIDYILIYGGWSDTVLPRLVKLAKELDSLADKLKGVRNKILSHNDLATIVAGATLGEFAEGADEKYFKDLQEFVNIVHHEVIGGQYPFDDLVRNDVELFLNTIKL